MALYKTMMTRFVLIVYESNIYNSNSYNDFIFTDENVEDLFSIELPWHYYYF